MRRRSRCTSSTTTSPVSTRRCGSPRRWRLDCLTTSGATKKSRLWRIDHCTPSKVRLSNLGQSLQPRDWPRLSTSNALPCVFLQSRLAGRRRAGEISAEDATVGIARPFLNLYQIDGCGVHNFQTETLPIFLVLRHAANHCCMRKVFGSPRTLLRLCPIAKG